MLKGCRLLEVLFSVELSRQVRKAMKGLFLRARCFTAGVSLYVARFLGNFEKKKQSAHSLERFDSHSKAEILVFIQLHKVENHYGQAKGKGIKEKKVNVFFISIGLTRDRLRMKQKQNEEKKINRSKDKVVVQFSGRQACKV